MNGDYVWYQVGLVIGHDYSSIWELPLKSKKIWWKSAFGFAPFIELDLFFLFVRRGEKKPFIINKFAFIWLELHI